VVHGSSSIPQEYVDLVNTYGGKMPAAIGIPEDQLREASRSAVCKINIDSDGRIVMTGSIRKAFADHPDWFDPRQYIGLARTTLKDMYARKNREVLGSAGHAFD
jgi:fructose-bisphosphate aldolase class II